GREAVMGGLFLPGEGEEAGADPVIVLAHNYWRTHLGGDPGIVGRKVAINGGAFTAIGITPPSFTSAQWAIAPSAFILATMIPELFPDDKSILESREAHPFKLMAHLRPASD